MTRWNWAFLKKKKKKQREKFSPKAKKKKIWLEYCPEISNKNFPKVNFPGRVFSYPVSTKIQHSPTNFLDFQVFWEIIKPTNSQWRPHSIRFTNILTFWCLLFFQKKSSFLDFQKYWKIQKKILYLSRTLVILVAFWPEIGRGRAIQPAQNKVKRLRSNHPYKINEEKNLAVWPWGLDL